MHTVRRTGDEVSLRGAHGMRQPGGTCWTESERQSAHVIPQIPISEFQITSSNINRSPQSKSTESTGVAKRPLGKWTPTPMMPVDPNQRQPSALGVVPVRGNVGWLGTSRSLLIGGFVKCTFLWSGGGKVPQLAYHSQVFC